MQSHTYTSPRRRLADWSAMLTKGTVGYIIVKAFIKILQCRIKKTGCYRNYCHVQVQVQPVTSWVTTNLLTWSVRGCLTVTHLLTRFSLVRLRGLGLASCSAGKLLLMLSDSEVFISPPPPSSRSPPPGSSNKSDLNSTQLSKLCKVDTLVSS